MSLGIIDAVGGDSVVTSGDIGDITVTKHKNYSKNMSNR
jgi:hypothetical protein